MERSGQFHADAEEARTYPVSQHRDVRCFGQPDSAIDLDSIPAILLPRSKEDETEPEHVHASASMASWRGGGQTSRSTRSATSSGEYGRTSRPNKTPTTMLPFPDIEILPTFKPEFVDESAGDTTDTNDNADALRDSNKKSTRRTTRVSRRGAVKKVGSTTEWQH